jgi:HJR/Mrr/RecB family endonuclease
MESQEIRDKNLTALREKTWEAMVFYNRLIDDWDSAYLYFTRHNFMSWMIYPMTKYESEFFRIEKAKLGKQRMFGPSNDGIALNLCQAYEKELRSAVDDFVSEFFEKIKIASHSEDQNDWRLLSLEKWQPLAKCPKSGLVDHSPRNAEFLCSQFLKFMGATGAEVTKASKDQGLDITSDNFVGQVKHLHSKVGVKAIRELLGASVLTKKQPVFFSKSGYTDDAIDFAIANEILVYTYDAAFRPETHLTCIYDFEGFDSRYKHEPWMNVKRDAFYHVENSKYLTHWRLTRNLSRSGYYDLNRQKTRED